MFRPLLIASTAIVAIVGGVVILAAPSAEVRANTPTAKSDQPEIQLAADECSQHAWPYYPGNCIRDHRRSSGKASDVRVVFASQLPNVASSNEK
jgi:hypothetical protein